MIKRPPSCKYSITGGLDKISKSIPSHCRSCTRKRMNCSNLRVRFVCSSSCRSIAYVCVCFLLLTLGRRRMKEAVEISNSETTRHRRNPHHSVRDIDLYSAREHTQIFPFRRRNSNERRRGMQLVYLLSRKKVSSFSTLPCCTRLYN